MTATLLPAPRSVFCDANGNPLAGGFVWTYIPGGTTPKTTWQDAAQTTPNTNPVVLDSAGSCLLYGGSGAYKLTVTDANGNAIPAYSGVTAADVPFNTAATGQYWYQMGAIINRINDRLFIGGATVSDATYPPVVSDWFQTYMDSAGYVNFCEYGVLAVSTSPAPDAQETVAITVSAQSLDSPSAGASCIAVEAFTVNNHRSLATLAWTYYGEARLTGPHCYSSIAMELDTYSTKNTLNSYPYNQGDLIGLQLASGCGAEGVGVTASISGTTLMITAIINMNLIGGVLAVGQNVFGVGVQIGTVLTGGSSGMWTVNISQTVGPEFMVITPQFNSSAAIQIEANPTSFSSGITFGSQSITGCDGVNGAGIAIALAKGHEICWFNSSNNICNSIISTNTSTAANVSIGFSSQGMKITAPNNTAAAYFFPVADTTNWLTFSSAPTGGSPCVSAGGSDSIISLILSGQNNGNIISLGALTPASDNAYVLGDSTARWSAVYAVNGTIQTSQASLKTDIQPLPDALPLVMAINPVTYRWIDGGTDPVVSDVEADEDVYEDVIETVESPEIQPDGSVHLVSRQVTKRQQVFDNVAVIRPDGTPVIDRVHIKGKPHDGNTEAQFRDDPRMHAVARKQTVMKSVVAHVSRPGKRTHWGFLAADVQAAIAGTGRDFAGYVKMEDGTEGLRPDQMIPVLWKACQELAAEVAALKAARP